MSLRERTTRAIKESFEPKSIHQRMFDAVRDDELGVQTISNYDRALNMVNELSPLERHQIFKELLSNYDIDDVCFDCCEVCHQTSVGIHPDTYQCVRCHDVTVCDGCLKANSTDEEYQQICQQYDYTCRQCRRP